MNHPAARLPHSGLGIASTLMAVVGGVALLATFGFVYSVVVETGGEMPQEDPRIMAMGLAMIACGALLFLGAVLGVAGLFVGERRRLFSWLGLVFSGLPLLALTGVIVAGLALQ